MNQQVFCRRCGRMIGDFTVQVLPGIPGHQHIIGPDGEMACGCRIPDIFYTDACALCDRAEKGSGN